MSGTSKLVKEFHFKISGQLRIFPEAYKLNLNSPVSLVATASKYGLIFVGTPTGFCCLGTNSLLTSEDVKKNVLSPSSGFPRREITLGCQPTHLAVSCDNECLGVVVSLQDIPVLKIYSCTSFGSNFAAIKSEMRMSNTPGVRVRDLQWNPGVANLIGAVLSDGSALVFEVKDSSFTPNTIPPNAQVTCLCWSPKGKQVVMGGADGSLTQYKPELKAVKALPPPGPHMSVVSVHWLSNFQFIAAYVDISKLGERPTVLIVNAPKNNPSSFIPYEDICFGSLSQRPEFFFIHLHAWNMMVVGCGNSMEVNLMGLEADGVTWSQWRQEEGCSAELPLTSQQEDTFNVGLALDTSPSQPFALDETFTAVPMPLVLTMTNVGVLCLFTALNLLPSVAPVCAPPQPLPDQSGIHLFTIPRVPSTGEGDVKAVEPSKTTAAPSPAVPSPAAPSPAAPSPALLKPPTPAAAAPLSFSSPPTLSSSFFAQPVSLPPSSTPLSTSFFSGPAKPPAAATTTMSPSLFSMDKALFQTTLAPTPPAEFSASASQPPAAVSAEPPPQASEQASVSMAETPAPVITVPEEKEAAPPAVAEPVEEKPVEEAKPKVKIDKSTYIRAVCEELLTFYNEFLVEKQCIEAMTPEMPEEKVTGELKLGTESLTESVDEALKSLKIEDREMKEVNSLMLELYSWMERIQGRIAVLNSPVLAEIRASEDLDPYTKQRIKNIHSGVNFLQSRIKQTFIQIESLKQAKKDNVGAMLPTVEAIIRTIMTQNNILNAQRRVVVDLEQKASRYVSKARDMKAKKLLIYQQLARHPSEPEPPDNEEVLTSLIDKLHQSKLNDCDTYVDLEDCVLSKRDKLKFIREMARMHGMLETKLKRKKPKLNMTTYFESMREEEEEGGSGVGEVEAPSVEEEKEQVLTSAVTAASEVSASMLSSGNDTLANSYLETLANALTSTPISVVKEKPEPATKTIPVPQLKPKNVFSVSVEPDAASLTSSTETVVSSNFSSFATKSTPFFSAFKQDLQVKSTPVKTVEQTGLISDAKLISPAQPSPFRKADVQTNSPSVTAVVPQVSTASFFSKPLFKPQEELTVTALPEKEEQSVSKSEASQSVPDKENKVSVVKTAANPVSAFSSASPFSVNSLMTPLNSILSLPTFSTGLHSTPGPDVPSTTTSVPVSIKPSLIELPKTTLAKPVFTSGAEIKSNAVTSGTFSTTTKATPIVQPSSVVAPPSNNAVAQVAVSTSASPFLAGPTTRSSAFAVSVPSSVTTSTTTSSTAIYSNLKPPLSIPSNNKFSVSVATTTSTESFFGTPVAVTSASNLFTQVSQSKSVPIFGATVTTCSTSLFAAPATTSTSMFGGSPSAFSSASAFGTPTQAAPVFGAETTFATPTTTATPLFGSTPTSSLFTSVTTSSAMFAAATTPTTSSSLFGATTTQTSFFVATTTTSQSLFGSVPATTSSSLFGAVPVTTTSSSMFGSSTTTTSSTAIFGSTPTTSTPIFGSTSTTSSASLFGSPATTASSLFGSAPTTSSIFGSPAKTTASIFGTAPSTTCSTMFGSTPSFGLAQQSSPFGSVAPAKPEAAANPFFSQPSAGLFGQAQSTGNFGASGGSLFGSTTFGSSPQTGQFTQQTGGSIFGGSGGGSLFGNTGSQPIFGGSPPFQAKPPSAEFGAPSTFGSPPSYTSSLNFGSPDKAFGSPPPNQSAVGFGSTAPNMFDTFNSQNSMTFGNLAQNQPNQQANRKFESSSFTSWR